MWSSQGEQLSLLSDTTVVLACYQSGKGLVHVVSVNEQSVFIELVLFVCVFSESSRDGKVPATQ